MKNDQSSGIHPMRHPFMTPSGKRHIGKTSDEEKLKGILNNIPTRPCTVSTCPVLPARRAELAHREDREQAKLP